MVYVFPTVLFTSRNRKEKEEHKASERVDIRELTVEELLEHDISYIPESGLSTLFSKTDYTELRKAYESGVRVGWDYGRKNAIASNYIPHNEGLTEKEYKDFMCLVSAFGYQFIYIQQPSCCGGISHSMIHPGLNIIKDTNAIKAGVVIPDEVKQNIYQILKENSDSRLWK